ncbi:geranylgeranyl pyrophosphate synthetase [Aspergillus aculeatinus CBS 121060]|uniref:Geranylgeranyl pyrophosphate synthetase n=1 Tax=Aspergillus aculeatinus CBS 121060 TaxID=1448322 RepID=A0ACD1GTM7_9EURO|nr:geranylgeranyl pyrophosphate synthetase [Aspergillus aculeatinus CBS 121060]RAH64721.1 geranylgeranyl pyrophosphate synthetase [Aspergillus aculeatinus CBS 121060]
MTSVKVAEISRADLRSTCQEMAWITDTIAVPGSPALWTSPELHTKLHKDYGLIYIAQNAARHPASSLEPLFRAVYLENPSFDIRSIDLVTDQTNIRKLLAFVNPKTSRNDLKPFTLNVERVCNTQTVMFCRSERETYDTILPYQYIGFAKEFAKAFTTEQVTGSTGHYRIISYRFGGLKLMVRHETDGYVGSPLSNGSTGVGDVNVDEVSRPFEYLYYGRPYLQLSQAASLAGAGLSIKREGQVVPIQSTLEVKTRAVSMPIKVEEVIPQLWVSQTPNLVRAYHMGGLFGKPTVEDMTAEIKKWEEAHQHDLERFVCLLQRIISVVEECGGKAVLKYDADRDKLELWEGSTKDMLPADLYDRLNQEKISSKSEPASSSDRDSKATLDP